MSKEQIVEHVLQLERRRRAALERLLQSEPLVLGGLSRILQRCGKASCHSAKKPTHPVWRLSTSRDGRRCAPVVRQDDVERFPRFPARVNVSKAFAEGLREIDDVRKEQKALLRVIREKRDVGYE